ncbi:hypothetical protein SALBM135S_03689 [Streptomyces alboniger]
MKPEAASALLAGPFALATLSAPESHTFPALVTPDGQVLDLRPALGDTGLTMRGLLDAWDAVAPRLAGLANDNTLARRPLTEFRVHAPVEPRQVFQSGAQNYRQHVDRPACRASRAR